MTMSEMADAVRCKWCDQRIVFVVDERDGVKRWSDGLEEEFWCSDNDNAPDFGSEQWHMPRFSAQDMLAAAIDIQVISESL